MPCRKFNENKNTNCFKKLNQIYIFAEPSNGHLFLISSSSLPHLFPISCPSLTISLHFIVRTNHPIMRFGLPDGYTVAIPQQQKPYLPIPEPIKKQLHVSTPTPLEQFHAQVVQLNKQPPTKNTAIESLSSEFKQQLTLQSEYITQKTQLLLHQQRSATKKVIQEEKARLERERKQREAEEAKRKEEERKRKEEEERKRKEEEERKKKEEEERKKKELEELKLKQQQETEEKKRKQEEEKIAREKAERELLSITSFRRIEREFVNYSKAIADIKSQVVEPVNADPTLKKQVGQVKRKVNVRMGQLLSLFSHLNTLTQELALLIDQTKSHPLAFKFILNFTAKAIVAQAETEVAVNAEDRVQPLARLLRGLLKNYPEFEYFLSARLVKKAPHIIGYSCTIDTEEGRKRMGWKRVDGKWEDPVKYEERVSGIMALWAVMTQLVEYGEELPLYLPAATWLYMARMLNTDLKLVDNSHFTGAATVWDVAAATFLDKYGIQLQKLLYGLSNLWPLAVADRRYSGAARLLIAGEEWQKKRAIPQLKPMAP